MLEYNKYTLFRLYKSILSYLELDKKFKNSELSYITSKKRKKFKIEIGDETIISDPLIFKLKSYTKDAEELEKCIITNVYYRLYRIKGNMDLSISLPKSLVNKNINILTILSVLYIHGYNEYDMLYNMIQKIS